MSAAKQDEQADRFGGHANLAEALAAFQAEMPTVGKNSRNNFGSYADLADVARVGHPVLAKHGLSFNSKPTLNADGLFVLAYKLRHVSGETDEGEFLLPSSNTMQAIGGSITYARRYALCAVTGLVADEDTDAHDNANVDTGAAREARQQRNGNGRPPAQRQNGQASQQSRQSDQQQPPAKSEADEARESLLSACQSNGWDSKAVAASFKQRTGQDIGTSQDADAIRKVLRALTSNPAEVLGEPQTAGASG